MALTKLKTGAIADDAVTTDKLANAINTERTANTAKVSLDADSVTGAKIADDAIDSEHYVDGSIDTAHIADNQITLAKMAGGTDGQIITYDASGDPVAVGPGTDGQVLTSTGAGSPPAFEDVAGGGKILQVVTATTSTESSTTSTSFSDNGVSLAITPSATSSKILVMVNVGVQSYANTYNAGVSLKLFRDSTEIHTPMLTNELYGFFHASSGTANMFARYPLTVLDSPNTTSSITYKTQHAALSTSHTTKSQPAESGGTSTSYITLMEVGA